MDRKIEYFETASNEMNADIINKARDVLAESFSTSEMHESFFDESAQHAAIEKILSRNEIIGDAAMDELVESAQAEIFGAGPLQQLIDRYEITDVLVNGVDDIYIDKGFGLEKVDSRGMFNDGEEITQLAKKLVAISGARIDNSTPIADAVLPNGVRVHCVLPPVSRSSTLISLRIPRKRFLNYDALLAAQMIPTEADETIRELVAKKANIIISGGTGAGKTTLLAGLLSLVGPNERIVCIEEVQEISQKIHPHFVSLSARKKNVDGQGEVTLSELVKASLRMRPDRVVLGECRGDEIKELLSALNTGHKGGFCTIHANSSKSVPARLVGLAISAKIDLKSLSIQAFSALDIVLHISRCPNSKMRYISEIGVFTLANGNPAIKKIAGTEITDGKRKMVFSDDFEREIKEALEK